MNANVRYLRRRYTRRGFLRVAATTACGSLLTACGDNRLVRKLRVSPAAARVDEPFTITLKDLSPWQRVTLRARFVDAFDVQWTSRPRFGLTYWGRWMYPGSPR